jgi:deoxycytidylate deaminase
MDNDPPIQYPADPDNWWVDRMYLQDAFAAARHSTDPNTQVGCVLTLPNMGVVLSSWNHVLPVLEAAGYPRKTSDKGYCTEHAERAIIYKSIHNGLPISGLTLYCTWASCAECARTLIQFGIKRVVTLNALLERTPYRWRDSITAGGDMLRDAGVELVGWRGDLGTTYNIRFNGQTVGNEDLQ